MHSKVTMSLAMHVLACLYLKLSMANESTPFKIKCMVPAPKFQSLIQTPTMRIRPNMSSGARILTSRDKGIKYLRE